MRIEDNTIFFKSEEWIYELEKKGLKPNYISVLDYKEAIIMETAKAPTNITIENLFIENTEIESFKRELTDISIVGHILDKSIVIFSWRHKEE